MPDHHSIGQEPTIIKPENSLGELAAGTTLGRYEIIKLLGRGGMGQVYLARHELQNSLHALKILPAEAAKRPGFVGRFRTELRTMARLRHDHIVHVQYSDQENGLYYLVMDFIAADNTEEPYDLEEALAEEKQLSPEVTRHLMPQICEGLAFAHAAKVVHRDLKPANILLTSKDLNRADAKVGDFGLARVLGEEEIRSMVAESMRLSMSLGDQSTFVEKKRAERSGTGAILGTYGYMSPEQEDGRPADERSDIYALGVMMYRMLTGQRLRGRAKAASALVDGLDPAWDTIIDKCLENDPADRWQSAGALKEAIQTIGTTKGTKGAKEKNRITVLKVFSVLCVLIVLGLGGGMLLKKANVQRSTSNAQRLIAEKNQARAAEHPIKETTQPPAVDHSAEIAKLLASAETAFSKKRYSDALMDLGKLSALDAENAKALALKDRILAAMAASSTQPATRDPQVDTIDFAFKVAPPGAALTLTHDTLGLVAEKTIPAEGLSLELAPGTYHALVTAPGYRTVQQDVEVSADSTDWKLKLSERRGELTIRSQAGVSVSVKEKNGKAIPFGKTNAQGELSVTTLKEGDYTVELSLADYAPLSLPVSLIENKPVELKKPLAPLPGKLKIGGRDKMEIWASPGSGSPLPSSTPTKLGAANEWIDLPAGEHDLELRCRGFRTERLTVTIPPNRDIVRASPELVPESGGIRIAVNAPGNPREGKIRIDDGQWRTVPLPRTEEGLSVGRHTIGVQVSGFSVQGTEKNVAVRDGQTAPVSFTLTPKPGTVTVACNVAGAEVFDGAGNRLGKTGDKLSLSPFVDHRLTVKAPKHKAAEVIVRIPRPEADAGMKRVTLEEIDGPVPGENWTSSATGMKFVWIPALKCWVGKYEVTNGEYRKKESSHDSKSYEGHSLNGDRQPVVYVNFDDAKAYGTWLTGQDRAVLGGARYRLPTDDEWMTFAQCGDGREYPWGNNWPPRSGQAGNYADSAAKSAFSGWSVISGYSDGHKVTCDVKDSWGNPWGLYGVGGNVWECASESPTGSFGAWRGASWYNFGQVSLRCSYRNYYVGSYRNYDYGFRLLLCR